MRCCGAAERLFARSERVKTNMIIPLLFVLSGFLLGSILFSYHLPKALCGVDVVTLSHDGNPGTANAMKLCGVPVGLLCLLCDMLKGYLPVRLAMACLPQNSYWLAAVMIAPVLGHALAVFYPFQGGKAVAVSFGVLLGLTPYSWLVLGLVAPYLFFSLVVVLHPNERRSVFSFLILASTGWVFAPVTQQANLALGASGMAAVAMWKNRVREPVSQPEPEAVREKAS